MQYFNIKHAVVQHIASVGFTKIQFLKRQATISTRSDWLQSRKAIHEIVKQPMGMQPSTFHRQQPQSTAVCTMYMSLLHKTPKFNINVLKKLEILKFCQNCIIVEENIVFITAYVNFIYCTKEWISILHNTYDTPGSDNELKVGHVLTTPMTLLTLNS